MRCGVTGEQGGGLAERFEEHRGELRAVAYRIARLARLDLGALDDQDG